MIFISILKLSIALLSKGVVDVSSALYDLFRRDTDIAIRSTNSPPDHLIGRKVSDITWSAYASKVYLKKNGKLASTQDLSEFDLIGADESLLRIEAYKWLMHQYTNDNFSCSANDVKTITTLCDEGLGIDVLPTKYFNENLVKLFDVEPEFKDGLWILTHPDLRQAACMKEFTKFLYQYMVTINL